MTGSKSFFNTLHLPSSPEFGLTQGLTLHAQALRLNRPCPRSKGHSYAAKDVDPGRQRSFASCGTRSLSGYNPQVGQSSYRRKIGSPFHPPADILPIGRAAWSGRLVGPVGREVPRPPSLDMNLAKSICKPRISAPQHAGQGESEPCQTRRKRSRFCRSAPLS